MPNETKKDWFAYFALNLTRTEIIVRIRFFITI